MLNSNGISIIISNLSLVVSFCFFIIGWLIAFISTIIYSSKGGRNSWMWWATINCLISACVVYLIIDRKLIQGYRFALMTYLGICFHWSVQLLDGFLHYSTASANAIGVGHLLISVAYFIWILYFGCEPDTAIGKIINSDNDKKGVPINSGNNNYSLQNVTTDSAYPNEKSVTGSPTTVLRAEALFDYTANKDDPNEISFSQGEIMEILDNNGRWWQAKRADGTMGIVPSNFFKLV